MLNIRVYVQVKVGGRLIKGLGRSDGEKWVCLEHRYGVSPGQCLVYAFGIAGDFSFDHQMDKTFNCKV